MQLQMADFELLQGYAEDWLQLRSCRYFGVFARYGLPCSVLS